MRLHLFAKGKDPLFLMSGAFNRRDSLFPKDLFQIIHEYHAPMEDAQRWRNALSNRLNALCNEHMDAKPAEKDTEAVTFDCSSRPNVTIYQYLTQSVGDMMIPIGKLDGSLYVSMWMLLKRCAVIANITYWNVHRLIGASACVAAKECMASLPSITTVNQTFPMRLNAEILGCHLDGGHHGMHRNIHSLLLYFF